MNQIYLKKTINLYLYY